jgi:hypothetical protein
MQAVRLALRGRAGQRLAADRRELAAVAPHRVKFGSGSPARPATSRRAAVVYGMPRVQAAVSASSPSSARMWQAWRMSLRASDRAARLPSLRALTCA